LFFFFLFPLPRLSVKIQVHNNMPNVTMQTYAIVYRTHLTARCLDADVCNSIYLAVPELPEGLEPLTAGCVDRNVRERFIRAKYVQKMFAGPKAPEEEVSLQPVRTKAVGNKYYVCIAA
jgi:hypothetical protein